MSVVIRFLLKVCCRLLLRLGQKEMGELDSLLDMCLRRRLVRFEITASSDAEVSHG